MANSRRSRSGYASASAITAWIFSSAAHIGRRSSLGFRHARAFDER